MLFAAFTTTLVIIGALLTLRTNGAIAAAEPLVQRAARMERGVGRIVIVALALIATVLNLARHWHDGGIALMAGLFSGLGIAVLAGAIAMAVRLVLRYRGPQLWHALGGDIAGFALMGIGALLRYGAVN